MFDWLTIAILLFAAAIHASFQLSLGLLLLINSHSIGSRNSHAKTLWLNIVYIGGFIVCTALLLALLSLFFRLSLPGGMPEALLLFAVLLNFAVGISVIFFYYRSKRGTELWIGKSLSTRVKRRSKSASSSVDVLSLSILAVAIELLLAIAPLSFVAILLMQQPPNMVAILLPLYVAVASAPLIAVAVLIGGGHKVSTLQRWRQRNRTFLQYATGAGLLVLSVYVYAIYLLSDNLGGTGL